MRRKIGKVKQLHMQMLALTSSCTEKMIKYPESSQHLRFIGHFTEILHCDNFAQYPRDGTLKLLCMAGHVCSLVQQPQFGSKTGAENEPCRVHSVKFGVQMKTLTRAG